MGRGLLNSGGCEGFMSIRVKYFVFFEELVGRREDIIRSTSVNFCIRDLVDLLSKKYGDQFRKTLIDSETKQIKEGLILLLNNIKGYLDQRIEDGDTIYLLSLLAGG